MAGDRFYISVTRSWEVAEDFARFHSKILPLTPSNPAYVYILDIHDSGVVTLLDPVVEIANSLGTAFASSYHHDGAQDIILGLADYANYSQVLTRLVREAGIASGKGPHISGELQA